MRDLDCHRRHRLRLSSLRRESHGHVRCTAEASSSFIFFIFIVDAKRRPYYLKVLSYLCTYLNFESFSDNYSTAPYATPYASSYPIFVTLIVRASKTNCEGSCNDVVEIELKEGLSPVKLQRGPKSYCGLFMKAFESFHDDVLSYQLEVRILFRQLQYHSICFDITWN